MASTINIPLTTLTPSQIINVPSQSISNFSQAQLLINRNVGANSLDSTPTASIMILIEESLDGGNSWKFVQSSPVAGGVITYTDKLGNVITVEQSFIQPSFSPGATHARATVTNGSVSVSISGTLTLS